MPGLDYSQKRLLGKVLRSRKLDAHTRRLKIYAVLTGFLSLLVSIATLILYIRK